MDQISCATLPEQRNILLILWPYDKLITDILLYGKLPIIIVLPKNVILHFWTINSSAEIKILSENMYIKASTFSYEDAIIMPNTVKEM